MTGNRIKIIDKSWALIEHNFKLKSPKDRLKIIISNKDLRKKKLTVDELLIIPSGKNLIKMEDSLLYINNRFYYKNQK
jgi:hypothetical protein